MSILTSPGLPPQQAHGLVFMFGAVFKTKRTVPTKALIADLHHNPRAERVCGRRFDRGL